MQVVKRRIAHRVRPPEVGMRQGQARKLLRRESNLALLTWRQIDRLLQLDRRLTWPRDRTSQRAAGLLRRVVAQSCVHRKASGRLLKKKLRVHQRHID